MHRSTVSSGTMAEMPPGYCVDRLAAVAAKRPMAVSSSSVSDPELGFDNDATTMEFGELYSTQLYITHLVAYEIPRTTSLTLHSQYNPVIESASTEFLLHSDAVECQLDATYAEDGELTFEIDVESFWESFVSSTNTQEP